MPQYMLLIYQPVEGPPSDQQAAETPAWMQYTQGLQDDGVMVHGAALQGLDTATTVRVRDDETQIVDGPFAETKEFLAGYYLLDCPDLDAALAYAARIPNIRYGSTEVRPVLDVGAAMEAEEQAQAQA
jgi:hypothetical protein